MTRTHQRGFAVIVSFITAAFLACMPLSAHAQQVGTNLIQNPSLETASGAVPASWAKTSWGTPTPTFAYPVAGHTGNGASISFSANSTGDARWQHALVTVTPGTQYTFSIWYKSTVATEIDIEYRNASNVASYGWLANVPSSAGAWAQYTGTFTVPTGMTKASVFQLLDKAGSLVIDDVSLSSGSVTPPPPPPGAPTVTLGANPASITSGQSSTLTWSSTNATSCTASGAWTGSKATSGTQVVSPTANATYTLTCNGGAGTTPAAQSVTISVGAVPPPPAGGFAEGMVSITFDDSWTTQYTNAMPILQAAGMKGTFYLTTQPLQEAWDDFMTPNQVKDIAAKGHEIAGHTVTHADLTTLSQSKINAEIKNSKTYLQTLTGKTVSAFAYPYGAVNNTVKTLLKNAGYTSARGIDYETRNTATTDKFDLKSQCIETSDSIASIKAQIDAAKAQKQWYILCVHEVKNGGDQYTTTPARLQEIVNYIKTTGVKVVTVEQGRALMR